MDGGVWYSPWGYKESDKAEQLHFLYTVKGFSVVSEAEDVFLEFLCFFYDPMDAATWVSGYMCSMFYFM